MPAARATVTAPPNLLQEAADRAGRTVLSELLTDLEHAIDLDAYGAEDAVRDALVRAFMEGVRAGAVEHAASCIAQGVDARLEFDFADPAE
jgi:hypothetical protein